MALSPPPVYSFASPKRKRGHEDSSPCSPQYSPSKTRNTDILQAYPLLLAQYAATDEPLSNSQSTVTKFQNLAIRGGSIQKKLPSVQHDRKEFAAMSMDSIASTGKSASHLEQPQVPNSSSIHDIQAPPTFTFDFEAPPSNTPESLRGQSRSPPLNGKPQDDFWHNSEITGHDAADPEDDGYGINGIGFKPTAAIAWARSQKRKQQIVDYKSRETKEARQRRVERRRVSLNLESEKQSEDRRSPKRHPRVRFEDG